MSLQTSIPRDNMMLLCGEHIPVWIDHMKESFMETRTARHSLRGLALFLFISLPISFKPHFLKIKCQYNVSDRLMRNLHLHGYYSTLALI